MKKLDQKGMTGPVEIGLIIVFVVFVGFVAYRIGAARDASQANSGSSETDDEVSKIDLNEEEADTAKEVDVPAEEETKESEPEVKEEEPSEPVKKEEPKEETEEKPKPTKIDVLESFAGQDGDTFYFSATLEKSYTGTCFFKLKKDGQEKIYKEVKISTPETVCSTSIPVEEIPVEGEWSAYMWFTSAGKTIEAYAETQTVVVEK